MTENSSKKQSKAILVRVSDEEKAKRFDNLTKNKNETMNELIDLFIKAQELHEKFVGTSAIFILKELLEHVLITVEDMDTVNIAYDTTIEHALTLTFTEKVKRIKLIKNDSNVVER